MHYILIFSIFYEYILLIVNIRKDAAEMPRIQMNQTIMHSFFPSTKTLFKGKHK